MPPILPRRSSPNWANRPGSPGSVAAWLAVEKLARVDGDAVLAHFEMQMDPGAVPRTAGDAEQLAPRHLLSDTHLLRGEVRVQRDDLRRHLDEDDVAVALEAGCVPDCHDFPGRRRPDVERAEHADVEPVVVRRERVVIVPCAGHAKSRMDVFADATCRACACRTAPTGFAAAGAAQAQATAATTTIWIALLPIGGPQPKRPFAQSGNGRP